MTKTKASQRYTKRTLLVMTAYVVILLGVTLYFRQARPTGVVAYVAAILPALPIVAVFALLGRYMVEEQDEYLRMLLVRQSLFATAFAMTIATMWGFLESFDLVPHVDAYYVAILWFAGNGIAGCANALRARRA